MDLEMELCEAEAKAWRSLASYKFMMFGYRAAIWVSLNRIGEFNRPNPFKPVVDLAQSIVAERVEQASTLIKQRG